MREGPYRYWPMIHRPRIEWPNGARVAFWVGLNVEHYYFDKWSPQNITPRDRVIVPDPPNQGWRDYGPRVGIWRIIDVLDKHKVRASVLLNSDVCLHYPEIIEEGRKRHWVWLAHGKDNSIFETDMALSKERRYLAEVVKTIEEHTGTKPKGWLGPALTETFNTIDILARLGLTYVCDWVSDDQPYPIRVRHGKMISVPYSLELNDMALFVRKGLNLEDYYNVVKDQFDTLYDEGSANGRVMALPLHTFVTGQPFRQKYLDKVLEYICGHEKVWVTTSDEIAEWYYENYYDKAAEALHFLTR